jgi:hypothetical protein
MDGPKCIGFLVRSREGSTDGKFWWVGHYYAGSAPEGPSIGWCQNAAERHAERLNEEGRQPWEFEAKHQRAVREG